MAEGNLNLATIK